MRSGLTFASFAVVAVLLAGCTAPDSGPSDQDDAGGGDPATSTPGIVTEVEGTSDLEDDPWVIAARAEDTGYVLAVNALDFSIPEFTETHDAATAQQFYEYFVDEFVTDGAPVVMFPGPSIRLPLEVHPTDDGGGADLIFCDASVDWAISAEFPDPAYDLTNGTILHVSITTDERGNRVFQGEAMQGESCDATGAPVQRFDPAPVLPDGPITFDDVTPPSAP